VFQTPNAIFTDEMLRPELQGLEPFVAGIDAIVEAHERVAQSYFADGSVQGACPPLCALLHVMAYGHFEGKQVDDPELRRLFSRESVLQSAWYQERLVTKQRRDLALLERHAAGLTKRLGESQADAGKLEALARLVAQQRATVRSADHLQSLVGTLGADPFHGQVAAELPAVAHAAE
jgi:hypothetical protein